MAEVKQDAPRLLRAEVLDAAAENLAERLTQPVDLGTVTSRASVQRFWSAIQASVRGETGSSSQRYGSVISSPKSVSVTGSAAVTGGRPRGLYCVKLSRLFLSYWEILSMIGVCW